MLPHDGGDVADTLAAISKAGEVDLAKLGADLAQAAGARSRFVGAIVMERSLKAIDTKSRALVA